MSEQAMDDAIEREMIDSGDPPDTCPCFYFEDNTEDPDEQTDECACGHVLDEHDPNTMECTVEESW